MTETAIRITDEEYAQCLRMVAATWVRNGRRWARDQVSDVDDAQYEVAADILAELADEGLAWGELDEKVQFKWANRVVSRYQTRVQRDQKRLRSGDQTIGGHSDFRRLWDVIAVEDTTSYVTEEDTIDSVLASTFDKAALVEFFVEHGIDFAPSDNTVDKLLAWANDNNGFSKAELSRRMGFNDNAIAMAIYEVKRHGVERRYKREVTA